jgi:hypothetical protein
MQIDIHESTLIAQFMVMTAEKASFHPYSEPVFHKLNSTTTSTLVTHERSNDDDQHHPHLLSVSLPIAWLMDHFLKLGCMTAVCTIVNQVSWGDQSSLAVWIVSTLRFDHDQLAIVTASVDDLSILTHLVNLIDRVERM